MRLVLGVDLPRGELRRQLTCFPRLRLLLLPFIKHICIGPLLFVDWSRGLVALPEPVGQRNGHVPVELFPGIVLVEVALDLDEGIDVKPLLVSLLLLVLQIADRFCVLFQEVLGQEAAVAVLEVLSTLSIGLGHFLKASVDVSLELSRVEDLPPELERQGLR